MTGKHPDAEGETVPKTTRPVQVYSFALIFSKRTPNVPHPGDRLDAQFRTHADAIAEIQQIVDRIRLEPTPVDVHALAAEFRAHVGVQFEELSRQVQNANAVVAEARLEAARAKVDADRAKTAADSAEARLTAAVTQIRQDLTPIQLEPTLPTAMSSAPMPAAPMPATTKARRPHRLIMPTSPSTGPSTCPPAPGPTPFPPNILAINAISGDHWSSRWSANRSANAFGMLAWWYMGAWPSPGPPTTPLTPTGQPISPGAMYFNTTLGVMQVWNGSTWVNATQPGKATTSSLYYLATASQTLFPLATADRNGKTFAFNQTAPEGLQAFVNGVRLEPTFDFTVDTVASAVTFLRPLTLNAVVIFDLLTPTTQLTPSGTVNTVLLSPIVPDGVKTVFTGLTVASNGHAVNVAKNEELSVSVDGVIQQPGAAYNASAAQITFAEAPAANANIFIVWFGPANP